MKLRFLEQTVCDFKSFEGEHTLVWDAPGVTFMCGENKRSERLKSNGSGKSSLFDALCWCLFGRTPGGLRNPDIMPWSGSGNPSVTQHVKIDGKPHVIQRTVSPNRLLLDAVEASQERLEEFLGLNFDLFTNTLLLAQGHALFFDLPPKDKMALFADTLQLDRWDVRAKAADLVVTNATAEELRLSAKMTASNATVTELEALLADAKQRAEAWVVEQRVRVREAAKRIAALEKEHTAKDKLLVTAQLEEDGAGAELAAVTRASAKVAEELVVVEREANRAEAAAEAALQQCKREIQQLSKARVCPTCGQSIKVANVAEHRAHLEKKLREHEAVQPVPAKTLKAIATLKNRAKVLLLEETNFRAKLDRAEAAAHRLHPEVATLKAQLTELRRVAKADEANPHTAQIASLQSRLKVLKASQQELSGALTAVTRTAERNKFWAKGFKDIKLQLIEDVLDELELATNSMIEEVGLVDWEVRYDIERETKSGTIQRALSVQIISPESKDWVRWESWSGGEQQRLRLIGALALADVLLNYAGVEANLEILDEPALYWSSEGVQELCAFLAERARQTERSIFFVEHNAVESAHFSSTLTVVRDKEGSYVAG